MISWTTIFNLIFKKIILNFLINNYILFLDESDRVTKKVINNFMVLKNYNQILKENLLLKKTEEVSSCMMINFFLFFKIYTIFYPL